MRTITKIAAISMLALTILPASASAHSDKGDRGNKGWHFGWSKHENKKQRKNISGTVTAVTSPNLTVKAKDGTIYTVTTDATTKFQKPFGVSILFGDVKVNDTVAVTGMLSSSVTTTIAASMVVDTPPNTHVAKGAGTVTAVNGNTVTMQTNNHGIISNVTVNTDSTTTVTKSDNTAGTLTNVIVGSKIKVKGLWNEITNVLNAINIHIK